MYATVADPTPDCAAIKLVGVRGSGDTSSSLGVIAAAVSGGLARRAHVAGLSYRGYGVPYTAVGIAWYKLTNVELPEYRLSVRDGRNKLYGFIHEQARDCPTENLAVVGYSQGAQVVGDVFSKGLGRLTATELARVKAVVLVADPRFNSRESYDRGSFREGRNGLLGARTPGDLSSVSNRLRAWCRKDDPICQGPGTTGNHDQDRYLADYRRAIVAFLGDRLGLPPPPTISPLGYGPVHFGMTVAQAEQALGGRPIITVNPSINNCEFWDFPGIDGSALLGNSEAVAIGGKFTLFFPPRNVASNSGVRVGDRLDQLRAAYPAGLRSTRTGEGGYARLGKTVQTEYAVDKTVAGVRYTLDFAVGHRKVVWMAAGPWSWLKDWTECA